MIEEYRPGSITIDGETYDYDVQVRWTGEVLAWETSEDYLIDLEDLESALEQNPEAIIIGTGEAGEAQVTDRAREEIESRGIKLIVDRTEEATKTFNVRKEDSEEEEGGAERVVGFFHLT